MDTDQDPPELLRMNEAARLLSISRAKAYELVASGELPSIKVGASIRIRRRSLLAWLDDRETPAAANG